MSPLRKRQTSCFFAGLFLISESETRKPVWRATSASALSRQKGVRDFLAIYDLVVAMTGDRGSWRGNGEGNCEEQSMHLSELRNLTHKWDFGAVAHLF